MRLHHHHGSVFATGSRRHSHRHVAYCVGADGDIVLGGEVEQVLADFFFLFGRTWHLVDLVENREHQSRLEVFDSHGWA